MSSSQSISIFLFSISSLHIFFTLASQTAPGQTARHLFTSLSLLSGLLAIKISSTNAFPYNDVCTLATITLTLRAVGLLAINHRFLDLQDLSPIQRLRVATREWLGGRTPPSTTTYANRVSFAATKTLRLLAFYALGQLDLALVGYIKERLGVSIWDYAPAKQGIVPLFQSRHLWLRGFDSVRWIVLNYWTLGAAHEFFALIFVVVLRWDEPAEWQPLFGSISEAYTLRRFWGVFWHRLNLGVAEMYAPWTVIRGISGDGKKEGEDSDAGNRVKHLHPAARALWVFIFSALYHAVANRMLRGRANLGQELRFFLINFALCYLETLVTKVKKAVVGQQKCLATPGIWARFLGYIWVYGVFFSVVPAWQWSQPWGRFWWLLKERGLEKIISG